MSVGEIIQVSYSEGIDTNPPTQNGFSGLTTRIPVYASDADFVTAKGVAATAGDEYFNSADKTTHFFDGSVWTNNCRLGVYASDSAFVSAKGAAATVGDEYFNSTDKSLHFFDNTVWQILSAIPIGSINAFAGTSFPAGWLLCDGTAVSRTTYAALFTSISTAWGYGDNSTTFNVPDLRGLFLRGKDGGATRDPDKSTRTALKTGGAIGDNVGSYQNQATVKNLMTASSAAVGGADGVHSHTPPANMNGYVFDCAGGYASWVLQTGADVGMADKAAPTAGSGHGHAAPAITLADGSVDHETRPKNVNVNYIIKY